jgi:hypothetical protein
LDGKMFEFEAGGLLLVRSSTSTIISTEFFFIDRQRRRAEISGNDRRPIVWSA